MHIPLHKPFWGKRAEEAIVHAMREGAGTADGAQSMLMRQKLRDITHAKYAIPVTSCTHAMESAVAALGLQPGDEVIVPSFTLSATATAVLMRGGIPVFADVDPETFCLDPDDVEKVMTKRTVGIITVHYAGMAGTNFDRLRAIAKLRKLWLVEDAAHAIGAQYKGKALGTFGQVGALSFHGTKNVACGEGGAILTKSTKLAEAMEIYRSIGTDRAKFLAGKVSAYRWVGEGSSFMLADLLAALVNVQLDQLERITHERSVIAHAYTRALHQFSERVQLPMVPRGMTQPNWHIYALKFDSVKRRDMFFTSMRKKGIEVTGHYMPLHTAPMGIALGGAKRALPVTEDVAATIVRLPIYAGMTTSEREYVISHVAQIVRSF